MKLIIRPLLATLILVFAAPAFSAPGTQVQQLYYCEFNNDDATNDQLLALSAEWLKAARSTKGGEKMNVVIRFPIAEGINVDYDFSFVLLAPSFADWGTFTDAYEGSEVAKVDDKFRKLADCTGSTLWEAMLIKVAD